MIWGGRAALRQGKVVSGKLGDCRASPCTSTWSLGTPFAVVEPLSACKVEGRGCSKPPGVPGREVTCTFL